MLAQNRTRPSESFQLSSAQGGCMVATMDVQPEETRKYGVIDPSEDLGALVRAKGLVEKPAPEQAPSTLAVIGRYILTPQVMERLDRQERGAGGEIQLTDAIAAQAAEGRPVYGFRFRGQRFDCGAKGGYLQATIAFALARDDLSAEFRQYLRGIVLEAVAAE